MTSRHLVDPEIVALIEQFPSLQFDRETLVATRAMMLEMGRGPRPEPDPNVVVWERLVPGPAGEPQVRVIVSAPAAEGANRPGVLHVHGGGYVMGSADMGAQTDVARAS